MSTIKTVVRGAYDIQKLRIQMGNRIVGNFKDKIGQEPSKSESTLDSNGKMVLSALRVSYKKITDGVKTFPRQATFKGDGVIDSYTDLCLVSNYIELEVQEATQFKRLGNILKDYPIWTQFMKDVKGIGPAMAGVIISEINISAAQYSSSLWKYAGLDVASNGAGRSMRSEHLVDVEYESTEGKTSTKKGKIKTKKSITFNPFLKTKLMGMLAGSFIKSKSPYADIYYDYKNRLQNSPKHQSKSDGHRHSMSLRYMIKIFLLDLYKEWRTLEGLPVSEPYHEAKLGITHRKAA